MFIFLLKNIRLTRHEHINKFLLNKGLKFPQVLADVGNETMNFLIFDKLLFWYNCSSYHDFNKIKYGLHIDALLKRENKSNQNVIFS